MNFFHKRSIATICFFLASFYVSGQKSETIYLSGTGADDTKTWEFYCSDGMNSKKWTTIQVPSCWEQQGFGQYNYGHVPFEERLKETGTYRHTFDVPRSWSGKSVSITFEGVMTDALVKINGKQAGPVHQGAFNEFHHDISRLLKYGRQNQIEVLVKKHSDNTSINMAERKADFWIFGGIFRPVYIEARPKQHIRRVAINALADGTFEADVYTSGSRAGDAVEVQVQDMAGSQVASFSGQLGTFEVRLSGKADNVKTWNPESPSMYKAVFRLMSKGRAIHEYEEKFGFRTVEIRESDGIYVNGTRVKLKGVNRHTFHPDHARTSSKALSIEAVSLMKEMNMNAVRMSHYPPEKHFLDVCDSLGLFVLDELTGWQTPAYDEEVGRKLLTELVERDVNHPSIIFWDNGNEGGWNDSLNDDFAKLDPQKRKVLHPWQDFRETNTLHYVDYDYLSLDGYSRRKIFFPTELLHGLYDGGHGAGLEDYWLRIWHHPLAAGAFLWVFADEAVARTDRNGALDADGNHAPDGILGPYMEKEASFNTIKKVWSPVFIDKRYITPQFNGVFNIENRYHFTNLSECSFTIEWLAYSDMVSSGPKANTIFSEKIETDLAPGQKGTLEVSLPNNWMGSHVLSITAVDKEGKDIAEWTYPVQTAAAVASSMLDEPGGSNVSLNETSEEYQVKAGTMAYSFDRKNGMLTKVNHQNRQIPLTNGPVFVSKDKAVQSVAAVENADGTVSVHSVYGGEQDSITWVIRKNGQAQLSVAYEPAGTAPYAGISFSFPEENVAGMEWMGNGPDRVWKNRTAGPNFGLWDKEYNNSMTGHSGFDYPEFKGYYAETYWANIRGDGVPGFKVYIKSNDIFLRMLTPDQPDDGRTTVVDFPKGDISFLHGINAIGTKFKASGKLGPQSSLYQFNAKKIHQRKLRIELVFDFAE
ncbi:MAG: glycoside hydrolase family 2 TIM barrel-domain containing protein [Cyclobacteriaceae bacterium]